tara:strand:- start:2756 stop:3118 length:363 start_codon:yes stop_codon:yes gene_type:complete
MLDNKDLEVGKEYELGNNRSGEYKGAIVIDKKDKPDFPSEKGKAFVESHDGELFHAFASPSRDKSAVNIHYVRVVDSRKSDGGVVESESDTYHTEILTRNLIFEIEQARALRKQFGGITR